MNILNVEINQKRVKMLTKQTITKYVYTLHTAETTVVEFICGKLTLNIAIDLEYEYQQDNDDGLIFDESVYCSDADIFILEAQYKDECNKPELRDIVVDELKDMDCEFIEGVFSDFVDEYGLDDECYAEGEFLKLLKTVKKIMLIIIKREK